MVNKDCESTHFSNAMAFQGLLGTSKKTDVKPTAESSIHEWAPLAEQFDLKISPSHTHTHTHSRLSCTFTEESEVTVLSFSLERKCRMTIQMVSLHGRTSLQLSIFVGTVAVRKKHGKGQA